MRIQAMTMTVAMLAGGCLQAAGSDRESMAVVSVFMDARGASPWLYVRAKATASRMFETAGVQLDWCDNCRQRPGVIVIETASRGRTNFSGTAFAYALPYEGTHIVVDIERVKGAERSVQALLFAHVLVHEITHILQGTARHSEAGVMKASFTMSDQIGMRYRPLPFTEADIELIHLGLQRRASDSRFVAQGGNKEPRASE
jgi:hypothetical protein